MDNNPTHDEDLEPIEPEGQDALPLVGNRPAENALRATAESDLNKSWQGGEGAADFLGLDREVGRPAEPVSIDFDEPAPVAAETVSVEPYSHETTIPLEGPLELEPEQHSEPAFVAEEPQQEFANEPHYESEGEPQPTEDEQSWLLANEQQGYAVSEDEQFSEAPQTDLEFAEALDTSFNDSSSSRSPMRMVAMAGLLLVAAGGTWFFGFRSAPVQPTEVAVVTPPVEATNVETPPTTTTNTVNTTADPVVEVSNSDAVAAAEDEALLAEFADLISVAEGDAVSSAAGPVPTEVNVTEVATSTQDGTEGTTTETEGVNTGERVERVVQIDPGEMVLLPDYSSSLRLASAEELGKLWTEATIPFEKFSEPARLLTPNVGRVRVLITGDEIFEGSLYAVGEGQIWVDSKIGRVALDCATVHDVQQLGGTERTPELGGKGSQNLAGLPRVRVRGAGGNFYGKIVAREGNLVTLIPDAGGRIRLHSDEVEVVGTMRTSLVRADGE